MMDKLIPVMMSFCLWGERGVGDKQELISTTEDTEVHRGKHK